MRKELSSINPENCRLTIQSSENMQVSGNSLIFGDKLTSSESKIKIRNILF